MNKIAIIGCSRSGTTYISEIFKTIGMDVRHEKMGVNGISDWHLTPQLIDGNFTILHQVRHPLHVIASMFTAPRSTWESINKFIPLTLDNILIDGMRYWYFYNLIAESRAKYTYRVENLENEWGNICNIIGIEEIKYVDVSHKTNSRKHGNIYWHNLNEEDYLLSCGIHRLSRKYGYE